MSPNTPPENDTGKWAALGLTALVHLALGLFLFLGVSWQSKPHTALEVSLVSRNTSIPSTAPEISPEPQPKPVAPPPPPPPKPEPQPPRPEPKVEAPKPAPKVETPKPVAKPDVAIKEPKKVEPKKAEPKPEPPKPEKKPEPKPEPKKPEPKPEPKPAPKPEPKKAEAKPSPKTAPTDTAHLNDQLERDLAQARMAALLKADTTRVADSRATAASAAALDEYRSRIAAKVRGKLVAPPGINGNPEAEFVVEQLPDGSVMSARLTRSSGNPALDSAIERAIHSASPLPKPKDPSLFQRSLRMTFRPLDTN